MQSSSSLVCAVCAKLASCPPITVSAPSRGATKAITAAAIDVPATAPPRAAWFEPPHADTTTAAMTATAHRPHRGRLAGSRLVSSCGRSVTSDSRRSATNVIARIDSSKVAPERPESRKLAHGEP